MIVDFWWGQINNGKTIHWRRRDVLALNKEMGGLGFRELETYNMALLVKMVDIIFKDPNSLWGWANICSDRDILQQEGLWRVGDGRTINALNDPWVYPKEGYKLEGRQCQLIDRSMKVCELLNADRTWNEDLVRSVTTLADDECILQIPLQTREREDQLIWPYTRKSRQNQHTTKSKR